MAEDLSEKYILMHKNEPIADIELDEASYAISAVGNVYAEKHVPVGITVKNGRIDRAALNEWWKDRAIPASRDGIKSALIELNITSSQKLLEKCLGLSLSDQYWICPTGSDMIWAKVNFFDHPFSDNVGNVLFGKGSSDDKISLMSPDSSSDGWLKKKWAIIDGKRCLIKGGSGATQQEPYNEVIASLFMDRLGISHIPYTLMILEDYPYSVCEDFITPQTELITAWYVMQTQKKSNHISVYQHYLNCCEALGIPGIVGFLDRMMVLDYIIANEDRHQNNFGVIRNAETLEWIGAAPIYDNGSSLWFKRPTTLISANTKLTCKPFRSDHDEQVKLVTTFDWLDFSALNGIDEEVRELLRDSIFIDNARCNAICFALKKRVEMLHEIVNSHTTLFAVNDLTTDVAENIEYSGAEYDDDEYLER